jgi:hypothetical protein
VGLVWKRANQKNPARLAHGWKRSWPLEEEGGSRCIGPAACRALLHDHGHQPRMTRAQRARAEPFPASGERRKPFDHQAARLPQAVGSAGSPLYVDDAEGGWEIGFDPSRERAATRALESTPPESKQMLATSPRRSIGCSGNGEARRQAD